MNLALLVLGCTPLVTDNQPHSPTFTPDGEGFIGEVEGLVTRVENGAVSLTLGDDTLTLRPVAIGRTQGELAPLEDCVDALVDDVVRSTCGTQATPWFVNTDAGLEFGVDVPTAPVGKGQLVVAFDLPNADNRWGTPGKLHAQKGTAVFDISGLRAWDADQNDLAATMDHICDDEGLDCWMELRVDDRDAVYPITIDPLVTPASTARMAALSVTDLAEGDLVITELMIDPVIVSDANGEWFEITNTTANTFDLQGLCITDDGVDAHTIGGSLIIAPGQHLVLGRSTVTTTNGNVPVDYSYGTTYNLANSTTSGDEIALKVVTSGSCSATNTNVQQIDKIAYISGWDHNTVVVNGASQTFFPYGASLSLDPGSTTEAANDDPAEWCDARTIHNALAPNADLIYFGTPGATNTSCSYTLVYQTTWNLSAGGTFQDCIGLNLNKNGTFTTTNSGAGTFKRFTYLQSSTNFTHARSGQFLEWTFTNVGNATPVINRGKVDFTTSNDPTGPDWDVSSLLEFQSGVVTGGDWVPSSCTP